ncbi:MAG: hypothetical protein AAFR29_06755, partial [Pseudomonadota bacterium]
PRLACCRVGSPRAVKEVGWWGKIALAARKLLIKPAAPPAVNQPGSTQAEVNAPAEGNVPADGNAQ